MSRKKISLYDQTLLRVDQSNNLMMVTGLIILGAPVDYERLKAAVVHSIQPYRHFRQRLVQPLLPFMRPSWEDDPSFNIDEHLKRVQIPSPGTEKNLQDLISVLLSTKLDFSHPLWEFYLVENYGKGSALIARFHHTIADGMAAMQWLLTLTEPASYPAHQAPFQDAAQPGKQAAEQTVKTRQSGSLNIKKLGIKDFWEEGKMMLGTPGYARRRARQGLDLVEATGRVAIRWPDPATVFKGPLGFEKRAAWSQPLDLKEVKSVGKVFNSTINDILLSALAGALGRYIAAQGRPVKNVTIRGFIPVNLRPLETNGELGNQFGLVFLSLPIGIDDPVERLRRIKRNMDDLKTSPEAVATFGLVNLLGATPPRIEEIAIKLLDSKGTLLITNVPGPQKQLTLVGVPVIEIMGWVPQTGRVGVGASIVSYNGVVRLGMATDAGLVPDPDTIVGLFLSEYEAMKSLAQKAQAERQSPVQPMLTMLDEAMQTLDELLAESGKDS